MIGLFSLAPTSNILKSGHVVQFRKKTPDAKKLVVHMKVDEYQCKVFLQGNDYTLEAMLLMVYYNSKIIPVKQIMKNEIRKNIYPRTN